MKFLSFFLSFIVKIFNRISCVIMRSRFRECGSGCLFFSVNSHFSYATISLGKDVYIGPNANFSSAEETITIGDKVMFGPDVMIIGEDHNISQLGKYMHDVKEKLPQNDAPIVICDDVWVGARSIILKGVTLGEGCVVAAGSIVTKSVPPYAIVKGSPAVVYKYRFTKEEIEIHRKMIQNQKS